MDMQAFDLVQQLCASQYLVRSLHVVAELGVADALGDGGRSVAELAASVGADADALKRVLRLLESRGLFVLDGDTVGHSAASEFLRTDHPASLDAFARMFAQPIQWHTAGELMCAVKTGQSASTRAFPEGGAWGYLAANPDEGAVFGRAMAAKSPCRSPTSSPPTTSRAISASSMSAPVKDTCSAPSPPHNPTRRASSLTCRP